jgi:hypothetical protein
MKKVIKLSESDLSRIITRVINEEENTRYMFFSNIEQMRRQCDILLEMDRSMVEEILEDGHDWAQDHISEAKNNMDQVFDFLMNETESEDNHMDDDIMMEGSELTEKKKKNKPTNPGLWQQCLAWAKQR